MSQSPLISSAGQTVREPLALVPTRPGKLINQVINADCLDVLPRLPSRSMDFVLTERGAGVHDGGAGHGQHLAAGRLGPVHAAGDVGHQQRLGLLGGDLGRHELERAGAPWPLRGGDPVGRNPGNLL